MDPDSFLKDLKNKLRDISEHFAAELKTFQTGRAHPSLLDGVMVEAYGTKMPLNQLASVLTGEASVLRVTPFDGDNVSAVSNAITTNEKLNLSPTDDGRVVYVTIPPLTTERRQQIAKSLATVKEDYLVRLRHARHQALKQLKDELTAEEEIKAVEKSVEASVAAAKDDIENLAQEKTKEILEL